VVEVMTIEMSPTRQSEAVALLGVVADPVRWRLLAELAGAGTRCVCDLQPVGGVAPNVLSYHLKALRQAGLVTSAKRGRWVDYTLAPDAHSRIAAALPTTGTPQDRNTQPGS
jgi:ArsR family transcriptional regulator, arsenate/arsenite/antimonite-responsive transcriptional repressor